MLRALREQNRIIAGASKKQVEQILKKYMGKIEWQSPTKGIATVPDRGRNRRDSMLELEDIGCSTYETGFSSGFWVEL